MRVRIADGPDNIDLVLKPPGWIRITAIVPTEGRKIEVLMHDGTQRLMTWPSGRRLTLAEAERAGFTHWRYVA